MNKIYTIDSLKADNPNLLWEESIFHNANGYIGVRGAYEEGYPAPLTSIRGQYINGIYDIVGMKQAEPLHGLVEEKQTIVNIADTQSVTIRVGDETFSPFDGEVNQYCRFVDMTEGITVRRISWTSPKGYRFRLEFRRMTSFIRQPLFLQEIKISSDNFSGPVEVISGHSGEVRNFSDPSDPRVANESRQYVAVKQIEVQDGTTFISTATSRSGLEICSGVGHQLPDDFTGRIESGANRAAHTITGSISKGQEICLRKYSWFTDSLRSIDPQADAKAGLKAVMDEPPERLYEEQRQYLRRYWQGAELEIEGDDELNLAVAYNQYALLQSAGRDGVCNMAAKGLSGEGYEGHYFWDSEIYAIPCFNIQQPGISRNLILYRYHTLDKARHNARALGHEKGALYPWRTINGDECSGYFPSGTAAYHINGDIVYAIVAYYLATGDEQLICDFGSEIIMESARLWMDMGNEAQGRFCIHAVTGPYEYTCMVNNNYYTNALAKYNLEWAAKCKDILLAAGKWEQFCRKINITDDEIRQFQSTAEMMYLPYQPELDINPQDDSFMEKQRWDFTKTPKEKYPLLLHCHPLTLYRKQVCKQADTVLAHFLLEDYQKASTVRNSYAYYEAITTHDSSLSTCIFSIMAAKLGMVEKAYDYFGESAKLDLFNTHGNTKDGIHTANMAGNYMAIVYGFAGLRIKEAGIHLAPCIPEQWQAYRFRFTYRGTALEVQVNREKSIIRRVSGEAVNLYVYDQLILLQDIAEANTRTEERS